MHILQPKHVKLNESETKKVLDMYNISRSQLPVILQNDPALPEECAKGDVIKLERDDGGKTVVYYRVVI